MGQRPQARRPGRSHPSVPQPHLMGHHLPKHVKVAPFPQLPQPLPQLPRPLLLHRPHPGPFNATTLMAPRTVEPPHPGRSVLHQRLRAGGLRCQKKPGGQKEKRKRSSGEQRGKLPQKPSVKLKLAQLLCLYPLTTHQTEPPT